MAVRKISAIKRKHQNVLGFVFVGWALLIGSWVVARAHTAPPGAKTDPIVVAEYDTVMVPVPARPITAGTKVKDISFTLLEYPEHQIPKGAITDIKVVEDSVTTTALPARLPIFAENFSSTYSTSNPVIERIPVGMRAMTIRVDATAAVEGWAGSGAFVDVLLIGKEKTNVVAEKVKILSAERSVSPVEGSGAPNVPSTVTLLVTQEQCLAINTAVPLGRIAFALRSSTDEAAWNQHLYTAERLNGSPAESEEKTVSGFVKLHGQDEQYALTEGQWIKTDVIPSGFMVGQK